MPAGLTDAGPSPARLTWLLLGLVTLAGLLVRAIPVALSDFPVNDGGLFVAMTRPSRTRLGVCPRPSPGTGWICRSPIRPGRSTWPESSRRWGPICSACSDGCPCWPARSSSRRCSCSAATAPIRYRRGGVGAGLCPRSSLVRVDDPGRGCHAIAGPAAGRARHLADRPARPPPRPPARRGRGPDRRRNGAGSSRRGRICRSQRGAAPRCSRVGRGARWSTPRWRSALRGCSSCHGPRSLSPATGWPP